MFGVGTLAFVLSKEIWVVEHGFMEFIAFWAMFTIIVKKIGPGMAKHFDSQSEVCMPLKVCIVCVSIYGCFNLIMWL